VAWSPDGQRLASVCLDGKMKVWDTENWQDLATLEGIYASQKQLRFAPVKWSPDSQKITSAGPGLDRAYDVKIWDVAKK
jgi:WD40 repeat protein